MQSFVFQRNSLLNMFSTQKITKLTSFEVILLAKMFRKVVKLNLTGYKNEKYRPLSMYGLFMPES